MADVSPEALLAIFRRYGRPLDVAMPAPAADDQRHVLGAPEAPSAVVRVLQVRGYGDVIPNDYFVLEPRGADAVAVSGPFFAAALEALARARAVRQS
jgi:hypothetical protein